MYVKLDGAWIIPCAVALIVVIRTFLQRHIGLSAKVVKTPAWES